MDTNRIKQRLNSETSKQSVNTDTFLKINLDGEERLLPPDEINKVVNVGDRFNEERQRSKFYRILGTINPTISNPLFNLNDGSMSNNCTWSVFNNFLDTSYPIDGTPDITYSDSIKSHLKEINGWFGYKNPNISDIGLCNFIDMEPKRERLSFVPDITPYHNPSAYPVKNWELTITYPKIMDKTHNMVNGGLLIVEDVSVIVSSRQMTAIGMACLHNLIIGDIVKVSGTNGYDGEHVIVRTGLDNGDLKGYYFVIDIPPTIGGGIGGNSRIKRMFGGQESEYYFRKFRKIKTRNASVIESDDYETYKLAFSENIYTDDITQFVFNDDIDISNLTDNLGRPLSELYLTIIKTSSSVNSSDLLFGDISSGIETPFISELTNISIPAINKIHNGNGLPFISHVPLEQKVSIDNNNLIQNNIDYYGDLVEYNKIEVKETILAEVSHRFNTFNRETSQTFGPRQEGYFYKAHNLIKIREYSNYVEQGDKFTEGIPDYAVDLGDGRFLWRDLLDIGFNETNDKALDYPFLNNSHYMYDNYCFYLRRQDPFANWGLYYYDFPSDPIGDKITDKFTTNTEDYVC